MCLVPEREKNPRKSAMPFVKCSYWKELYTERKLRLHTLGAVNSFCTAQGVDTEKGCKVFPFTCMVFPRVTALPRLVYFLVDCSPMPPWPSAATFTHLISQEKADACVRAIRNTVLWRFILCTSIEEVEYATTCKIDTLCTGIHK